MSASSNKYRNSVNVTGAKTLTAADCGIVQNVTASATITLPATADGLTYTIRNGGSGSTDGAVTVTVAPAAADGFTGNGFTAATNKAALNTLGNGSDEITIFGNGVTGATGWTIQDVRGTWTRAA